MATREALLPGKGVLVVDKPWKNVLEILLKFKSMPFLELTSLSDIEDRRLQEIITDLEKQDLVRVSNPNNIYEEIVTVKNKAFMLAH